MSSKNIVNLLIYIYIMFIDCKWVDTRWQWSFNMLYIYTVYTSICTQGVPGGMDKTSGDCSLC